MKKKDIVIIIAVAIVSAIFSYVLSNYLFGGDSKQNLTAPVVQPISADFADPDPRFFNANSLNPTQNITIGETQNNQPF